MQSNTVKREIDMLIRARDQSNSDQSMFHIEQQPSKRSAASLSLGRDSPPSDSSSPSESITSITAGSSSSLKESSQDESVARSRRRRQPHETNKSKNVLRIVSKVPDNVRSLQELDDIVGSGTLNVTPKQQELPKTSPKPLSEDEYYYDDDNLSEQEPRSPFFSATNQPKQELIGNLEEVKVVEHLMRPSPLTNDMQSVRSSRSRSSSRSLRRKRGTSLEREISRTILQTAIAGEAGSAHFLVENDGPENIGIKALESCSAQFILTDLFYEAARQRMEDALPDPDSERDGASPNKALGVEFHKDLFDGLYSAVTSSWVDFDKHSTELLNSEALTTVEQQCDLYDFHVCTSLPVELKEGTILESKEGTTSIGSNSWSPEERALYSHPTVEVASPCASSPTMDSGKHSISWLPGKNERRMDQINVGVSTHIVPDGVVDDFGSWTNFDNIPFAFIDNPFKDAAISMHPSSVAKAPPPPLTKHSKLPIPPPPQPRCQRGHRKVRATQRQDVSQSLRPAYEVSPRGYTIKNNVSPLHYSPASVVDVEIVTTRALAKGPKLQAATNSGSITWTPKRTFAADKNRVAY